MSAACGFERLGRGSHTARASGPVRERARPPRRRPVLRSIYRKMRPEWGMCYSMALALAAALSSKVWRCCRRKMRIRSGRAFSLHGITRTGNNWKTQRSSQQGYVLKSIIRLSPLRNQVSWAFLLQVLRYGGRDKEEAKQLLQEIRALGSARRN